ncbi:MAG: hypothetical protein HY773_00795 [Candidatus Terrybacteria bacterium]|nr:hypothetical protein [Candidatus Terrybacteria bacterium]
MKYPWVAISLIIIWFASTYIILKKSGLNVPYVLMTAIIGTIIVAIIGFRPPKIQK